MCHIIKMPSVNIRQLRNTRQLKEWLRAGKTVELRERSEVIGEIVPRRREAGMTEYPDFAGRTKKIFGDRKLPIVEDLINDRGRY